MEQICEDPLEETMLEIFTRLTLPTGTPAGPRMRDPSRRKMGDATVPLIVMFEMVTSSICAPSTLRMATPKQPSKTQFEMVMFLNPPFDSVPNLMRPLRSTSEVGGKRLNEASSTAPSM